MSRSILGDPLGCLQPVPRITLHSVEGRVVSAFLDFEYTFAEQTYDFMIAFVAYAENAFHFFESLFSIIDVCIEFDGVVAVAETGQEEMAAVIQIPCSEAGRHFRIAFCLFVYRGEVIGVFETVFTKGKEVAQ